MVELVVAIGLYMAACRFLETSTSTFIPEPFPEKKLS